MGITRAVSSSKFRVSSEPGPHQAAIGWDALFRLVKMGSAQHLFSLFKRRGTDVAGYGWWYWGPMERENRR